MRPRTSSHRRADAAGRRFEWPFRLVLTFDGADRIERIELFDEDDFPAALARLDELGAAEPADPRQPRAREHGDPDSESARRHCSMPDRFDDARRAARRRTFVQRRPPSTVVVGADGRGREAFLEVVAGHARRRLHATVIRRADRGARRSARAWSRVVRHADGRRDRRASRRRGRTPTAVHAPSRASTRKRSTTRVAELDARYLAGEGARARRVLDRSMDARARPSTAGLDRAARSMLPTTIVFVDHRQLWPATRSIAMRTSRCSRASPSRSDSVVIGRRYVRRPATPRSATYRVRGTSDAGGGAFEWDFHIVSTADRRRDPRLRVLRRGRLPRRARPPRRARRRATRRTRATRASRTRRPAPSTGSSRRPSPAASTTPPSTWRRTSSASIIGPRCRTPRRTDATST